MEESEEKSIFIIYKDSNVGANNHDVGDNDDADTGDIVTTGSGQVRWQAERRAAMATLLSYRAARWSRESRPVARLVWAGHEDTVFRNMFPEWCHHADVARINKEVSRVSHQSVMD